MAVKESKNPSSLKIKLDLGMVDDVEAGVKEFREKLTQAGFDKILEECQKQATEFVKSYN